MLHAFGRASLTACVLIISTICMLTRSQAPGDAASQTCEKKDVTDGVVRLLDSNWYRRLLLSSGSDNAGWTQTPADSVSQ